MLVTDKVYHVIGSGISGLVLAFELAKKGLNVRIYEKLNIVGGIARTEIIDGISYDCGPHLFHTNNSDIKNYWLDLLKNEVNIPKLYGANIKDNRVYEYPLSHESLKKQFTSDEVKIITDELSNLNKSKLAVSENYFEYVKNLAGEFLSVCQKSECADRRSAEYQ